MINTHKKNVTDAFTMKHFFIFTKLCLTIANQNKKVSIADKMVENLIYLI